MELEVYTKQGTTAGRTINVADAIFAAEPNEHAVYLAVRAQQTRSRQGTRATKNRALVSGGGKKPWRQKGRGTARAGTTRSPIWRGGGTVFGPQPVQFKYQLPKKVKRLARVSVLSAKAKDNQVRIVEDFTCEQAKTKEMYNVLLNFGLGKNKTLVLVPEHDEKLYTACRNIKNLNVTKATDASTLDLMSCHALLIMEGAVEKLESVLLS
ncbi:50S ribosomal protein L4 [candidate division KSB1 bacterium]|nr:50S ribosomal protein L4 [candidate division KSB1 bacterium]RQW05847.1 MAG: 50S ribosomal protein L4 [candidate division KSB1 bacterium]